MAKAKTKTRRVARKMTVDFSDEDSVKKAMAKALDCEIDDLEIEEESGLSGFREGTVYRVQLGRQEYIVCEDEDTSNKLAIAVVKQDLESEPEIFDQNFIQNHIDKDKLRDALMSDVEESAREPIEDEAKRRPIEFMKENDIDIPEPTRKQMEEYAEAMAGDEDEKREILKKLAEGDAEDKWIEMGEEPEVKDSDIENVVEETAKSQLQHPMSYLEDIYGNEAGKRAMEIAGFDVDAAAEEAVSTDGEGHFLSHYDGHMHNGPGGIVYWRTN
jgi:hypothetical protein